MCGGRKMSLLISEEISRRLATITDNTSPTTPRGSANKPLQKVHNKNKSKRLPLETNITKTCLYNFDPLKPHFYIVKLGFTGVYIIFLISAQKHRLWVLVRTASPRRFKQEPSIYVLSRKMKDIRVFLSEIFQFLEVKLSIYLNMHVFVMEHIKEGNRRVGFIKSLHKAV